MADGPTGAVDSKTDVQEAEAHGTPLGPGDVAAYLVGGLEHFFFHILGIIIPID